MPDVHLRVLDCPLRVSGLPPEAAGPFDECFGAFESRGSEAAHVVRVRSTPGGWIVTSGGVSEGAPTTRATGLLLAVATAVNRHALTTTPHLSMHAGVIGIGGSAVALPAASGAGKSTLVAAAVASGLTYLSDESLCLDRADGSLVPYPKPLGLSAWSRRRVGLDGIDSAEELVPATRIGPAAAPDDRSYALEHVVVPMVRSGITRFEPARRSTTVTTLLDRCFNHFHDPRGSFRLLAAAALATRGWVLEYEDLDEAVAHLRTLLRYG